MCISSGLRRQMRGEMEQLAVFTLEFAAVGLLFVALAIPLALNKVPPNQWYGFRVPATLNDPDVWYAVNAFTGRCMIWAGAATVVAATAFRFWPRITPELYALACTCVMVIGALGTVVAGFACLARRK